MATPKPRSRAQMEPQFELRLRDLQKHAAAEAAARPAGGQVRWFRPAGWDGDLTDFEKMAKPFARDQANADYLEAVKDPTDPGTGGDIIVTTTMIDYLASMEQAFRVRHTDVLRAAAHATGRKRGHGSDKGVFVQNLLEYVRNVLKQAKTP